MSEHNRICRHTIAQEASDVFRILLAPVALGNSARLTMSPKIRSKYMPPQAECGNQRQENLPSPAKAMQQNNRRTVGRPFGVTQTHFTSVNLVLRYSWEGILHEDHQLIWRRKRVCRQPRSRELSRCEP